MKFNVKLNKKEQLERQSEVWSALASTLPPDKQKTIIRFIISGLLLIIAIIVFIVIATNDIEKNMIVLAIILLIAGVATLSGTLYDIISKMTKKKKLLNNLADALDKMYNEIVTATEAEFDFGTENVTVTYSTMLGEVVKKFTCQLQECAVVSVCDLLTVDFTDIDAYCFSAEEIDKENLVELKKKLLASHESYRDVARDTRGKYYLVGNDQKY